MHLTNPKYVLFVLIFASLDIVSQSTDTLFNACLPLKLETPKNQDVLEWQDEKGKVLQIDDGTGVMINDTAPLITQRDSTTYTLKYVDPLNDNLVKNGDFETIISASEASTLSEYTYWPGFCNLGPGNFGIGNSPSILNPAWYRNIYDHTKGDGTGRMFYADGATGNDIVYRQTVTVKSGEEYALIAWLANTHLNLSNPHQMDFYINNEKVGELLGENSQDWYQYYGFWTSTVDGDVEVKYINKNKVSVGNDFAIDDIVMAPVKYKKTTIFPIPNPVIITSNDLEVQIGTNKKVEITPEMVLKDTIINCGRIDSLTLNKYVFSCNEIGSHSITLSAWQYGDTINCSATVTIKDDADLCSNDAPEANIPPYNVCSNGYIEDNLFNYILDPNGHKLTLDTVPITPSAYGEFSLLPDGQFVYTPTSNSNAIDRLEYQVCDEKGFCTNFQIVFNIDASSKQISLDIDSQICIINNTISFYIEDNGTGLGSYSIDFDVEAERAGFIDLSNVPLPTDNQVTIDVSGIRPNVYNALLVLNNPTCGIISFPLRLEMLYPESIIVQKWNSVLALLNAANNGGYTFSHYQWLKNGLEIKGQTSSILYLPQGLDKTAEYSVLLTREDDNITLESCPLIPILKDVDKEAFPQVVSTRSAVALPESLNNSTLEIWNIQGGLIFKERISDNYQFKTPAISGIYIVRIFADDHTYFTSKIVVH